MVWITDPGIQQESSIKESQFSSLTRMYVQITVQGAGDLSEPNKQILKNKDIRI